MDFRFIFLSWRSPEIHFTIATFQIHSEVRSGGCEIHSMPIAPRIVHSAWYVVWYFRKRFCQTSKTRPERAKTIICCWFKKTFLMYYWKSKVERWILVRLLDLFFLSAVSSFSRCTSAIWEKQTETETAPPQCSASYQWNQTVRLVGSFCKNIPMLLSQTWIYLGQLPPEIDENPARLWRALSFSAGYLYTFVPSNSSMAGRGKE